MDIGFHILADNPILFQFIGQLFLHLAMGSFQLDLVSLKWLPSRWLCFEVSGM